MTKVNWNIGKVNEGNDAIVSGAIKDTVTVVQQTASSAMDVISPSAMALVDNTLSLLSNPKNIVTGANYGKLAKTVPAIPMDIAMKAMRLPFSTLDNAVQYLVNNNLERGIEGVKSVSTKFIANILTNNGTREGKFLNTLGTGVEGLGDIIGTLVKTPTGAFAVGTSIVDKYLGKATTWTEGFLNSVRIQEDKNFIETKTVTPTADTPEASNDNRMPTKQAA